jgi:hypothetical protein
LVVFLEKALEQRQLTPLLVRKLAELLQDDIKVRVELVCRSGCA